MECFFIPCFTACHTKTVLEMVDRFFHIYLDFVCIIPFLCSMSSAKVGPEIFLGIDIEHTPTGRICAWVFTFTDPFVFFSGFIIFPLHPGTDKLHGRKPAAQMRLTPFPFHWESGFFGKLGMPSSLRGQSESFRESAHLERWVLFQKGLPAEDIYKSGQSQKQNRLKMFLD